MYEAWLGYQWLSWGGWGVSCLPHLSPCDPGWAMRIVDNTASTLVCVCPGVFHCVALWLKTQPQSAAPRHVQSLVLTFIGHFLSCQVPKIEQCKSSRGGYIHVEGGTVFKVYKTVLITRKKLFSVSLILCLYEMVGAHSACVVVISWCV